MGGVEVDFANNSVVRLGKAKGLNPGSDFDTFTPWKRRRCNLSDNGIVNAYYGDSNYVEDGSNGQCMVEQPLFYCKVIAISDDIVQYWISDDEYSGYIPCPGFKNNNGIVQNKIYLSTYQGSLCSEIIDRTYYKNDEQILEEVAEADCKLASIAGALPASGSTQNLTRDVCRTLAENIGPGWRQQTICGIGIDQILFLIEYATFDAQTAIGRGAVDKGSGSTSNPTGDTSSLGNVSGMASGTDGLVGVSYRGRENLWGNKSSWTDGININAYSSYIKEYGTFTDDTSTGYNYIGFKAINDYGMINRFGVSESYPNVFITTKIGKSNIIMDRYSYPTSTWSCSYHGGDYSCSYFAGLHYTSAKSSSDKYYFVGARLEYVPQS